MKTAIRKGTISAKAFGLKAVAGAPGTFEAIVSVFGNVDLQGDRIIPGAFADTLAEWKSSGDPIPVIFSHQWDTIESHIGEVLEAKELLPGDPMLPPELAANGGLWTKFALDVEDERTYAKTIDRLLSSRRIKEFSFAYDVFDERRGTDGANELVSLGVIEVGPTLKGANPATRLLADALDDDDPLAKIADLLAARSSKGAKASVAVDFEGAVEHELEDVYRAALEWARGLDVGNGGFYSVYLEATFPDEKRAIVLVEGWDDPVGEGIFFELGYDRDEAGTLSVSDPHEIEIVVDVVRKARAWKHRIRPGSAAAAEKAATVVGDPTGKGTGKAEDRETGKAEDSDTRTGKGSSSEDGGDPAVARLELAELETAI